MSQYLLEVENLVKHFPINRGVLFQKQVGAVHAVNGLNFKIKKGETQLDIMGSRHSARGEQRVVIRGGLQPLGSRQVEVVER